MSYLEDPRVFFAAERTLFAWARTGLALTAMGLAISRYQLLLSTFRQEDFEIVKSHASFYLGMAFVTVGWLSVFLPTPDVFLGICFDMCPMPSAPDAAGGHCPCGVQCSISGKDP